MTRTALLALAALTLTGCGNSTGTTPTATPTDAGSVPAVADQTTPLATTKPRAGRSEPTCATVSYRVTKRGVEVDVTVADTPELIQVEADDPQGQPVGGDTSKVSVSYAFKGAVRHHVLLIGGVKELDHVAVLPPASPYDGCNAYRRN